MYGFDNKEDYVKLLKCLKKMSQNDNTKEEAANHREIHNLIGKNLSVNYPETKGRLYSENNNPLKITEKSYSLNEGILPALKKIGLDKLIVKSKNKGSMQAPSLFPEEYKEKYKLEIRMINKNISFYNSNVNNFTDIKKISSEQQDRILEMSNKGNRFAIIINSNKTGRTSVKPFMEEADILQYQQKKANTNAKYKIIHIDKKTIDSPSIQMTLLEQKSDFFGDKARRERKCLDYLRKGFPETEVEKFRTLDQEKAERDNAKFMLKYSNIFNSKNRLLITDVFKEHKQDGILGDLFRKVSGLSPEEKNITKFCKSKELELS